MSRISWNTWLKLEEEQVREELTCMRENGCDPDDIAVLENHLLAIDKRKRFKLITVEQASSPSTESAA